MGQNSQTFFGHNSVIFVKQGRLFFFVMRNSDFDAFQKICIFSGKMGETATLTPKGLWLQNPTKNLAHCMDLLNQPLSQNRGFKI